MTLALAHNQAQTTQTPSRLYGGARHILAVGGEGVDGALASVELHDPTTHAWTSTASLATARSGLQALTLPDHTVMAVGGVKENIVTGAVEIYDPHQHAWSAAANLNTARGFSR